MRDVRAWLGVLIVASLVASAACSSPSAPTSDNDNDNGNGNSNNTGTTVNGQTIALTIDGAAFQPTDVIVTNVPAFASMPETLQIFASGPGSGSIPPRGVTIQMPNRVGTYDVGTTYNIGVVIRRGGSPDAYSEAISGQGSGTVEITSRTANTAEGRVNVSLMPSGQFGGGGNTCTGAFWVRF
jgi:hypothetical protein